MYLTNVANARTFNLRVNGARMKLVGGNPNPVSLGSTATVYNVSGLLPATAFAIVASTGDIYAGLWYPIIIASITAVVGFFFLPETKDVDITRG